MIIQAADREQKKTIKIFHCEFLTRNILDCRLISHNCSLAGIFWIPQGSHCEEQSVVAHAPALTEFPSFATSVLACTLPPMDEGLVDGKEAGSWGPVGHPWLRREEQKFQTEAALRRDCTQSSLT